MGAHILCSLSKRHCFVAQRNLKFVPVAFGETTPELCGRGGRFAALQALQHILPICHVSRIQGLAWQPTYKPPSAQTFATCLKLKMQGYLKSQQYRDTEFIFIFNLVKLSFPVSMEQLQNFGCKPSFIPFRFMIPRGLFCDQKTKNITGETDLFFYHPTPTTKPCCTAGITVAI